MHSILNNLEGASSVFGDRTVYRDGNDTLSFRRLRELSRSVATVVAGTVKPEKPVAVLAGRNMYTPACYLGIAMAGCFYAPMDPAAPDTRLRQILGVIDADVLIADKDHYERAKSLGFKGKIIPAEDAMAADVSEALIEERFCSITDASPIYVLFTSGSTGVPKGVLTSHHSMMSYLEGLLDVIGLDDTDIIGNQAPFDYIAAIRDMYLPLITGAETVILDPSEFAMPKRLMGSLAEAGITTLCWSATGLEIPARLGAFDEDGSEEKMMLPPLRRVVYSGSVISNPLLRKWQDAFPDTVFINQYGPTEATGSCTFHIIDHPVEADEVIPIGKAYHNYQMLVLNDDDKAAAPGEQGEICVRGPALALGYYNAPEQTAKSFVDNPLEHRFRETIYRTGDIGYMDENGVLWFLGRKDRQFKHLGHRIEPEEIEQKTMMLEGIEDCSVVYNADQKKIYLFYTGTAASREIALFLRQELQSYMVPGRFRCLDEMPRLPNGKLDRKAIEKMTVK